MMFRPRELQVQQVNCFYNYTFGLDVTEVDLLKTAAKLLKSGMAKTVCFSDLKAVYLDDDGEVQLEWLVPKGRSWDERWTVEFSDTLPKHVIEDLVFCLELSFHEQRIEGAEARQIPPSLRARLAPVVLERDERCLPIDPWLKLNADGIMGINFQLDTTWKNLGEREFIQDVVNLFQRYFDRIWVHSGIQRMDAEQLLPQAFESDISIGGQEVVGRRTLALMKEMRRNAKVVLEKSLRQEGRRFDLHGESWILHQIAGSEDQVEWEATIDLCRSIYASAGASQVVTKNKRRGRQGAQIELWQGRPSISLMRFAHQPQSKAELFQKYGPSLARILMRSAEITDPPSLPPDLRQFEDYSFHGNRSVLLWTWLRRPSCPENAWDDANTRAQLLENQARAEHFEYHNMRIARACATASSPPSDQHLVHAYETLATADAVIHQSSQAGEITDALDFLLSAVGTKALIASGKEQARWHLDERRLRNEEQRSRVDRWLAAVFGFVGAAGLADLVTQPFLKDTYPSWPDWQTGLAAFALAVLAVGILGVPIWVINRMHKS